MLNKKILAVALSMAVSGVAFGDTDAIDNHKITITVPAVKLLDVGKSVDIAAGAAAADIVATCTAPSSAGANFAPCGFDDDVVNYMITTNSPSQADAADIAKQKITVKLGAVLDPTWKLTVTPVVGTGTDLVANFSSQGTATAAKTLTDTTAQDVVNNLFNLVESTGTFTYALGPAEDNTAMASATSKEITVTYTIEAES